MILIALFLGSISIGDWNGLSADEQKQIVLELSEKHFQEEPFCASVQVVAKEEGDMVIFNSECLLVKKVQV
jgi:hypothetical protein